MAASCDNVADRMNNKHNLNMEQSIYNAEVKDIFYKQLWEFHKLQEGSLRKPWTRERIAVVMGHLKARAECRITGACPSPLQYYLATRYEVMEIDNKEQLIFKITPIKQTPVRLVPTEEYFDLLFQIHNECNHGSRDKILASIKNKIYIPMKAVEIFVSLCDYCNTRRSLRPKGKVLDSKCFNGRGTFGLIDFQLTPDGEYKWLLHYQESSTKFFHLRPLRSIQVSEMAIELLKVFLEFGAPSKLQCELGKAFTEEVIDKIARMSKDFQIQIGITRRRITQLMNRNQKIENAIRDWMKDNRVQQWSIGCYFVQYDINTSINEAIGKTPYEALFGFRAKPPEGDNPNQFPRSIQREELLETVKEARHSATRVDDIQTSNDTVCRKEVADTSEVANPPDCKSQENISGYETEDASSPDCKKEETISDYEAEYVNSPECVIQQDDAESSIKIETDFPIDIVEHEIV